MPSTAARRPFICPPALGEALSCCPSRKMRRWPHHSGLKGRPMHRTATLVFILGIALCPTVGVAQTQPGSLGGIVGNNEKSVSGGDVQHSKPRRPPIKPGSKSITSGIRVTSATLGENCGAPRGNVTGKVAAHCNGKQSCSLSGSQVNNPDPAFGCSKSFAAEWQCSGTTHANAVPASAFESAVLTLSCN
jgi:hypothetical protein